VGRSHPRVTLRTGARPILDLGFMAAAVGVMMAVTAEWFAVAGALHWSGGQFAGRAGPKREAEEIKSRIGRFLREELKLELSEAKTLITHASTKAAGFLGYDILLAKDDRSEGRGMA
jgi:hypothetical protein